MTSHLDGAVPVSTGFDHAFLTRACHLVGEEMRRLTGSRSTCIASAATLRDVLLGLRLEAEVLVVSADVFQMAHRWPGVCLGRARGDTRRAARPGYWNGHLVTIVWRHVLLDPTLDSVNETWDYLGATPMLVEVTPEFLAGEQSVSAETGSTGSTVRYRAYPGRGGYQSKQQFRPRWRQPVIDAVLRRLALAVVK
jgi:hypothetical protein